MSSQDSSSQYPCERIPVSLDDYRYLAQRILARDVFDYIDGGAGDEITLRRNRQDLDELKLLPLCLRNVSVLNLSSCLLGSPLQMPIGFSPTAFHRLVHSDGEIASARAAMTLGIPMIVSSMSSMTIEDIAIRSGHDNLWFQTYLFRDRTVTSQLVCRAQNAGYKAIVVTLGCPVPGLRDRNIRNSFRLPEDVSAANFEQSLDVDVHFNNPIHSINGAEIDAAATWEDLMWLNGVTSLPIVVKGLMNPLDVNPALECRASAIMVSNHGGRQLDTALSTIRALPEIAASVAGRVPVVVDGGFRRGIDVLKALALGADTVFIGRPVLWALAQGGQQGVLAMARLLIDELTISMQLVGCSSISEMRKALPHLLRLG